MYTYKETSSNNNRCTNAIQTQRQNILNENHCIDADKHETSHTNLLLSSSISKSHDEESISAKLRELRNKETKQLFCHIDYNEFHFVLHLTLDYNYLK
jgi:hypothetical protein